MSFKPIIVVAGEPNSIFLEIFVKSIRKNNYKNPIILIASYNLVKLQLKKLNYKIKINLLSYENLNIRYLKNDKINLLNVSYSFKKPFEKISSKSKKYISDCFELAFRLIKSGFSDKFINGPISKKHFLSKKYLGITEFLAAKTKTKKCAMLIYNKELSVCPLTTHLPIKLVSKQINRKNIIEKVNLINDFYKKKFKFKPNIGVLGLNPHCESIDKFKEDLVIIKPTIDNLKKRFNIRGPFPADTIFLKDNRKNFDVIIGMYHDQVLAPLKTIYEYNAINITLGLPFLRISPDHGPNEKMMGKKKSNPKSLIEAIKFLDKY
jgi:4-hydroxythreonine-4-phosphate dehydrogenase